MATDDEKSEALELLLKDSLHALESLENFQQIEDEDRAENQEPEENPAPEEDESPAEAASEAPDKAQEERPAPRKTRKNPPPPRLDEQGLFNRLTGYTSSAYKLARKTTGTSLKVGRALMGSQDQLRMMLAAGESLRDLREVAGMTVSDLSEALNIRDKSLLEAVEDGTATLSFELILRLAAVLARNDPIPFILKYTRTYSPDTWRVLSDWGVGRLPLHFEREREFINIYRGHDEARSLSDEGFKRVLDFTRKSFEMSLHFVAEEESRFNEALNELEAEREAALKENRPPKTPKRARQAKKRNEEKASGKKSSRKKGD